MTSQTKDNKRQMIAWSACSTCIFAYGVDSDKARCGFDKITKKWYHLDTDDKIVNGECLREPEPMEVMV